MEVVIAFVAGGVFTAAVNVISTEFAAHRTEGRQTRTSLRQTRLDSLAKTQAWVAAYTDYVLFSWVDVTHRWDPEKHSATRPGLVGDDEALAEYYDAAHSIFRCDRETNPPFIEDIEALAVATERVQRCLAEQIDLVAAGGTPVVISERRVAEITSETALIAGWWEGFGLMHRHDALHTTMG